MKDKADIKRIGKAYSIRDWEFIKLKPYRQLLVVERYHHKLCEKVCWSVSNN